MTVHNVEIADMFDRLADLLEIEDANRFRILAYRNAARTIRSYPISMVELLRQGKNLSEIPTVGEDLADKIKTIVGTGKLPLLDDVEARTPAALSDLMKIEGLGAKRVRKLYEKLGIQTIEDLRRAAHSGRIRELEGFGKKTEQKIRDRAERFSGAMPRTQLTVAEDIAKSVVDYLGICKGVKDIVVAGSYRRRRETVGDLDILITASKGSPVIDHFTNFDEVEEILSKGKTRASVRVRAGINVDLRVVPQVSYGAALVYFTVSKAHNIAIRKIGKKKGYKINEYGVFKGAKRIAGKSENEIYAAVGLPLIPPELRESRGELAAARKRKLPELITVDDIRGDLHCHTSATDGHYTLNQMAEAAAERGYEYISINDHSRHVTVARGLDKKRLLEQIGIIDKLNGKLQDIVILKSIELDILEDGSLDLPDTVLKLLDFTVCAVHYKFNLSRKKQTERILRAMDNPYFNILAHPDRLDLTDEACKLAKDLKLKVAIATDAHSVSDLDYMRFGIDQARRGWLEKSDVNNTRPLAELRKCFQRL